MPEGSQPAYEIALAHFIVADDVERSRPTSVTPMGT